MPRRASGVAMSLLEGRSSRQKPQPRLRRRKGEEKPNDNFKERCESHKTAEWATEEHCGQQRCLSDKYEACVCIPTFTLHAAELRVKAVLPREKHTSTVKLYKLQRETF